MNMSPIYERVIADSHGSHSRLHGATHWARVERNGLYLTEHSMADPTLVRLFAVLHDSMRISDGDDPEHGPRAAEYATQLRGELFELEDDDFETLVYAIHWHTDGNAVLNDTVAVCWDADRLDLPRVNIQPDPKRLFSREGKRIAEQFDFVCLERYAASGLADHRW